MLLLRVIMNMLLLTIHYHHVTINSDYHQFTLKSHFQCIHSSVIIIMLLLKSIINFLLLTVIILMLLPTVIITNFPWKQSSLYSIYLKVINNSDLLYKHPTTEAPMMVLCNTWTVPSPLILAFALLCKQCNYSQCHGKWCLGN